MHPALEFIEGSDPLIKLYGERLGFHDAEITRVELSRDRTNLGEAFLTMDLHMFAVEGVDPANRRFIHGRHSTASFQFEFIQGLRRLVSIHPGIPDGSVYSREHD